MNALLEFNVEFGLDGRRMHGLALGTVINNIDSTGQGRVQLDLPWLPGFMPWARVASLGAGMLSGVWWQPQIGEEVIVGFLHGEPNSPIILGSAWNAIDRPPAMLPTDAIQKRILRSPLGLEITFDDFLQSVTVSTPLGQKVEMTPLGVTIDAGLGLGASVEIAATGEVKISAGASISLSAPSVKINGFNVEINGATSAALESSGRTTVKGALVEIN